ncbi:MAG: ATP-binding cassette domain-containing protein [Candidatus Bathyarchaeia archaeon]
MVIEIEVKDVRVYYKSIKALDGVSLSVRNGEILSILGPNGSGKNTFLKVINGVLRPRYGAVYLDQRYLGSLPHAR